jgi:pathogen-inducible salicylic acid glucosyltransferase
MLQFSKRLQHQGVKITLAITKFLFKSIVLEIEDSISVQTISDGFDEGGIAAAESDQVYIDTFRRVGSETLSELVLKLGDLGCSVDCIVYDAFASWPADVARRLGIAGAAFYTQSCAVDNIYYHVYKGLLKLPLEDNEVRIPGLPPLASSDFPSFIADYGSYAAAFRLVLSQFLDIEKADWLFVNTFYELEDEVMHFQLFFNSVVHEDLTLHILGKLVITGHRSNI